MGTTSPLLSMVRTLAAEVGSISGPTGDSSKSPYAWVTNAADYGAVGDGVADDTAALQSALNQGGLVFIPEGRYRTTAELKAPSCTLVQGAGMDRTVIVMDAGVDASENVLTNAKNNRTSRTDYDEQIHISDLTVDGNAFNRSTATPGWVGNASCLTLSTVRNCTVNRVRAVNGYLHCFDVTASAYLNDGVTAYAAGPSYNVVVRDCIAENPKVDDGFTTHYSYDLLIDSCRAVRTTGGTWTSHGFEVDEGSWDVTVKDCTAIGWPEGFQAKGHGTTPPAHDITFRDCLADECTVGFHLQANDQYAATGTAEDIGRNILVDNCTYKRGTVYFPANEANPMALHLTGYRGVRIRNLKTRDTPVGGGVLIRGGATDVELDGFTCTASYVSPSVAGQALVHIAASTRDDVRIRDIRVEGSISSTVVNNQSSYAPVLIDGVRATGTDPTIPCVTDAVYGGSHDVYRIFSTGFRCDLEIRGGMGAGDYTYGNARFQAAEVRVKDRIFFGSPGSNAYPSIFPGTGSPEGVYNARPGSIYLRTDGGPTTSIYVKTSGTGNTGWTPK